MKNKQITKQSSGSSVRPLIDSTARLPAELFPPAVFIREEMEVRGWSIETLAEKSQIKRQKIEEILSENYPVTPIYAMCLANAFGTSKEFWLNLQRAWNGRCSNNLREMPAQTKRK